MEFKGTSYEVGRRLGRLAAAKPPIKGLQTSGRHQLGQEDFARARDLFDRWCPGVNEEILGFADVLGIDPLRVTYYAMTYLVPACSQIVVLPGLTENGHVLLARNYELTHRFENFIMARTGINGKYTHLGTSVCLFGRDEGMNECGLAVSMSSCGFPVGALDKMRKPALRGLQFWAVIRTLLENCADVGEALTFLEGMPIAYNINLVLADKSGHLALVETFDGHVAVQLIDGRGRQQYLHVTNHAVLPELTRYQSGIMRHSLRRYEYVKKYLKNAAQIKSDDLKALLLDRYPEGLCCHFHDEFLGTTKSVVMDLNEGKIEICWGGLEKNGWQSFHVTQPRDDDVRSVDIIQDKPPGGIFELLPVE